jgi:hypothetical protein
MRSKLLFALSVISFAAVLTHAQTRTPVPSTTPPVAKLAVDMGSLNGLIYRNDSFNFEVTIPVSWLIADPKSETSLKTKGVDLRLKAPKAGSVQDQTRLNGYAKRVTVLLTAFHPQSKDENTVLRIAVEDLSRVQQVKDAVDYFDLMRQGYQLMRLPADFKYSETQAEKLGNKQFAFLDTSSNEGKTRMYATVRNGYAILFTLSYRSDDELQVFRQMLASGNFALK